MYKYLTFLPFLILLIFSSGFDANNSNHKNQSPIISIPTPTPTQANESNEIILDKETVCEQLSPGFRTVEGRECLDKDSTVKVSAVNPENKQLKYEYTVTGGRVIGEGATVIWELMGGQPGTYQIRVDISDQSTGEKRSETKSVELVQVFSCGLCECPEISVNAPTSPTIVGEKMIFTANVRGGSQSEINYNWTVSDGKIIEGQGTPVITVATNSKMAGKTVKATIEIGGFCEDCNRTESASGSVAKTKRDKN